MKSPKTQEEIDEMRRRLYDRGSDLQSSVRHELTNNKVDVSRDWNLGNNNPQSDNVNSEFAITTGAPDAPEKPSETSSTDVDKKPKRHYRSFLLIGGISIFILVAGVSISMMYFGGNQISNDNIEVKVEAPQSIGGGEILPIQVMIANQNSVPIESATLILKYPEGTLSVGETPRKLFEERIPIDNIAAGQVQNIPVNVTVFGEVNSQKNIEVTVEYRVNGSNGMFYKDANPIAFRISSSPLVLRVNNTKKVASGQPVDVTLTAVSNASSPLKDVLVSASYPNGFTFDSSDPEPIYGQNVWRIDELLPEEEVSIKIKGIVSGLTEEDLRINFAVGPTDPDNQFLIGANLAEAKADFSIESPFIDIDISIDDDNSGKVILAEGTLSGVEVSITNTLDETVYDLVVEVEPGGNALNEDSISSLRGFYDSNRGVVRWETSNNEDFDKIFPGDTRSLQFSVEPGPNKTTASYDLDVSVFARRVDETSAQETLIGTERVEAKYSASIFVGRQADHQSGPLPPKVGEKTTYALSVVAEAGANDMTNAIVETSLPVHVEWLDSYDAEGTVTYNSVSKEIEWTIGDIPSGQRKEFIFQVGLTPSVSQKDIIPVLINDQFMRANDRFTSALLQDSAQAVKTELSEEMGYSEGNGIVGN